MKFLIIVIVSFSIPVEAMKRLREVEKDWDNDLSRCDDFCSAGREYRMSFRQAYFLPEKDQNRFKIFSDYLLWAKKMNDDEGLLKDITDHILRYSNAFMILSDKPFMDEVKKLDINESDVLCLSKGQRQGLWYILRYHTPGEAIEIDEPAEFSQKMVQNIRSLPIPIKDKIVKKYGNTIKATIHHKLLCRALCLDDPRKKCSCIQHVMCCSCCGLMCLYITWVQVGFFAPFFWLSSAAGLFNKELYDACRGRYNLSLCCETPEQEKERLGLVEISLLQEMECEIAEI